MHLALRPIFITFLLVASAAAHAATYTLAGGPSASANLGQDDDIAVYVNGVLVASAGCCDSAPLSFQANPGDALRVTVTDSIGGCRGVNPLYLGRGGQFDVLDPVGVPGVCGGAPAVVPFYDQTFVVPAPHTVPTLSQWGLIILSSLLALGALVALRRQQQ